MFAGLDACGSGWVVVLAEGKGPLCLIDAAVAATFAEAMQVADLASTVAVDIPIGLMDRGFRQCDLVAREIMGSYKGRVFKTSPRPAIHAPTLAGRHLLHRELTEEGLPPVAAAFAGKVADVDNWMLANGKAQERVFEVHPELCFRALNGGEPVAESKHLDAGLRRRHALLRPIVKRQDIAAWVRRFLQGKPRSKVKEDDVLDAVVACVTAATWAPEGTIPGAEPPLDSCGLRMEMRCPARR